MLRKRSRAVTSKVGDQSSLPVPWHQHEKEKPIKPISFFFNSPRIFKGFLTICSSSSTPYCESEPIMTPTSILDTKPFSAIANSSTSTYLGGKPSWEQPNSTKGIGIGLALVDENPDTINTSLKQQQKRKLVVFGSQLRIQVPALPTSSVFPLFSAESPREFGIKTPRSLLRTFGNKDCQIHPEKIIRNDEKNISICDMEESEDYTCVISHGPNPKTTHIFGNNIVEKCCGVDGSSFSSRLNGFLSPLGNSVPSSQEGFLSFCHHCKKQLDQGKDIFMYRGEKAFCSEECRCQEMLFDGVES